MRLGICEGPEESVLEMKQGRGREARTWSVKVRGSGRNALEGLGGNGIWLLLFFYFFPF